MLIIQYCPVNVLLFFAIVYLNSHVYFFLLKDSHENRNKVINIVKINWAITQHKFLKELYSMSDLSADGCLSSADK